MNTGTVARLLRQSHQTCTILRRAQTTTNTPTPGTLVFDPYGDPVLATYSASGGDDSTAVPCLAVPVESRRWPGEQFTTDEAIIASRYDFYFTGDTVLGEDDQLTTLAYRGTPVTAGYFEVVQVHRQEPFYLRAVCREVV